MAQIFLCHTSEDKPQVRNVYQRLKALGFDPWLDEEEILPGQDWDYEIEKALETSDFVMVFLSTRSVNKMGYVQREFRHALYHSEEMPEGYIHTIPIKLDECEVPRRFRRHQWANLNNDGAFERIIRALHLGLEQRGKSLPEPSAVDLPESQPRTSVTPATLLQTFTNSIGMELILIPAGEFGMGTPEHQLNALAIDQSEWYREWIKSEAPQHRVTISQPFYLGKYPVTQAQWRAVMGFDPSHFKGEDRPVEYVSWEDAQEFMKKLNKWEGLSTYRLPTEAEWEYACRAGMTTRYSFGDDALQLSAYAWYGENSGGQTHPVGQKQPNTWGLHDMHGNVWEWCQDWYGPYRADAVVDPSGPNTGIYRALRGGFWGDPARHVRAAHRFVHDPDYRYALIGFRCLSSGVSQ